MLSAPQRERTVGEPADEVVQVFTGDSLEEAMAYAVATLGPDLTVRRARKVRKGLQGLAGKDRYEVVALAPEPRGDVDAVEDAFASLLEQAEQRESGPDPVAAAAPTAAAPLAPAAAPPAATPARPVRRPAPPAPDVPAPRAALEPAQAATAPGAAAGTARVRKAPARKAPARKAPTRTSARKAPARQRAAAPVVPLGWSRAGLAAAGLPRPVLGALPAREPRDDAAWIAALAKAIATVLPPAGTVGRDHPVAVSGYGLAGVVGILDAALKGLPPGTISYDGRTAPATPTELALAVRSEVVR